MTGVTQSTAQRKALPRTALHALISLALIALTPQAFAALNCTVSVPAVNFGTYDTKNSDSSATTVTITCGGWGSTKSVSYTLTASSGPGSYSNRQMFSGSHVISYNLYTNSTHSAIWGDGTSGTATYSGTVTNTSSTATVTVYGLINSGQNVVPGAYATTAPITVTLTWQ